ncbi:hypothetical protein KGM_205628 [Danaus plexippus plexippus]|uniref:Uncharacterized protein n=1 Tax=Danaus plexippus plexippus TaxID=278856 RepID=A0A212FP01_DANPL|nr:hypothetical protein KGM_205628 [Danaus plexippus plexippus]
MGKATQVDGDNNPTSPESDPTKLLEAALLQMDGIIAERVQSVERRVPRRQLAAERLPDGRACGNTAHIIHAC